MKNIFEFDGKIDAATLPQLKKRDERFKYWQKWMTVGASFETQNGQKHTVIAFDRWGNMHALPEGWRATITYNLSSPVQRIEPAPTLKARRQHRPKASEKISKKVTVAQLRKTAVALGFPIRDGNRLMTKAELSAKLASRLGV